MFLCSLVVYVNNNKVSDVLCVLGVIFSTVEYMFDYVCENIEKHFCYIFIVMLKAEEIMEVTFT